MTLSAITDGAAVKSAINEFDTIGRNSFLQKYGFRPARSYYLLYRGSRYDSKAIIGAAHGYQFPDQGPLTADSFSGGEATVAQKLRSLGFEVSQAGFDSRSPVVWAFRAKPKRYRVCEAVEHLELDRWTIGRSDVRAGDHAIIWQTLDSTGHRGVVAFAEVLSNPEPCTDEGNPYWVNPEDGQEIMSRVQVAYDVPDGFPLWVDETETGDFLKTLSVAKAQGGTVFKVTSDQWDELTRLAKYSEVSLAEVDAKEQLRHNSIVVGGQGFGLTATERKAVEDYAMRIAMTYLESNWDSVINVSARCSYDLLCKSGSDQLRVEVKGTTTGGQQIILTRKEVKESKSSGYALFIVSEVVLDKADSNKPVASGGIARFFSPWTPNEGALSPISYSCDVDLTKGAIICMPSGEKID